MKAVVYDKYGSLDILQIREIKRPAPSDKEVLIKIHVMMIVFKIEVNLTYYYVEMFQWKLL